MRLRHTKTNANRGRRGANAIEFALTAPILFLLILSIMDFGWYFLHVLLLESATTHAARVAAFTVSDAALSDTSTATTAGEDAWDNYGIVGSPTFSIAVTTVSGHDMLDVTGQIDYHPFVLPATTLGDITVVVSRRAENTLVAAATP